MSIVFLSEAGLSEAKIWEHHLSTLLPDEGVSIWSPGAAFEDIDIAIVANPPAGILAQFPHLAFIQSAWAGVDALLADPTLPAVPIARLVDPALASHMAESVLAHVMALHCQLDIYRKQQQSRLWQPLEQPQVAKRRVGLLGLGEMGTASAELLARVGFRVMGWSRSGRPGLAFENFSGRSGLRSLLERSEILVNLLPLTGETRGILDAWAFDCLPEGAGLINVGRGGHVVMKDLLAALDEGSLSHAVLDVFETEPLPANDPLWSREDVTITPHVAAPTDPASAAIEIAANIRRFRNGEALVGLVKSGMGY